MLPMNPLDVKKESPYMGTIQFPVLSHFLVDDSYLHVAML